MDPFGGESGSESATDCDRDYEFLAPRYHNFLAEDCNAYDDEADKLFDQTIVGEIPLSPEEREHRDDDDDGFARASDKWPGFDNGYHSFDEASDASEFEVLNGSRHEGSTFYDGNSDASDIEPTRYQQHQQQQHQAQKQKQQMLAPRFNLEQDDHGFHKYFGPAASPPSSSKQQKNKHPRRPSSTRRSLTVPKSPNFHTAKRASLRNGSLSGQLQTPQQSKTANTDSRASSTNSSRSARGSISTGATPRALTIPCEFTFKTAERASVRNLSTAHGDGEELSDSLMRSFGPNSTSSSSFSTPKGRRPSTASSCSSSSSGRRSSVTPRALTVPVPFSFETEVRSAQKRELHAPLLTSEELAMQNIQPFKALPMNKHILDGVAGDIGVPRLRKTSLTQPMSPKLQTASRAQERRARESTAAEDLDDGGRRFSRFDTDAVTPRRSTRNSLGRRDSSASSSNSSSSSSSSSVLGRRRSSVAFDSDDSSSEAPAKRQRTSLSLTMPVSPKLATKRRASIRAARLSSAFGTQLDAAAADPDTETPSRFRSFDGSDRGRDSIASTAAAEPYVDSTPARSFESSLRSAPRTSISTQRPNKLGLTQPRPFNLQTESRQVLRAAQANIERRSERTREALRNLPSTRPAPASASKPEARATTSKTVAKAAVIPARVQPTRACAPRASTSTATNSLLSTATTTTTHRALVPTAKANMPIASSTTTRRAPSRVSKPTEPAAAAATEGAKQTVKATPAAKPERVLADISNTRQTSTAAAKKPTPALALASASTANIKSRGAARMPTLLTKRGGVSNAMNAVAAATTSAAADQHWHTASRRASRV